MTSPVICCYDSGLMSTYEASVRTRNPEDSGFDLYVENDVCLVPDVPVFLTFGISLPWNQHITDSDYTILPRSSIGRTSIRMYDERIQHNMRGSNPYRVSVQVTSGFETAVRRGDRLFQLIRHDLVPFTPDLISPGKMFICCVPDDSDSWKNRYAAGLADNVALAVLPVFTQPGNIISLQPPALMLHTGLRYRLQNSRGKAVASYVVSETVTLANVCGVVDSGYRGEILVAVDTSNLYKPFATTSDAIALIIPGSPMLFTVEFVEGLDETQRGTGGFGSTGLATAAVGSTSPSTTGASVSKTPPTGAPETASADAT